MTPHRKPASWLLAALLMAAIHPVPAEVVINGIMHHP